MLVHTSWKMRGEDCKTVSSPWLCALLGTSGCCWWWKHGWIKALPTIVTRLFFWKLVSFSPQHFLDRFSLVSFCSVRFWQVSFCPVSFCLVSFCPVSFWLVSFFPVRFWLVSFCPVSFWWMSFCPVRFCPVSSCLESASGFAGRCALQLCTVTTYRRTCCCWDYVTWCFTGRKTYQGTYSVSQPLVSLT